jgi:hypothetical protein
VAVRRLMLVTAIFCLALAGTAEAAPRIGIGNAVAVSPSKGHGATEADAGAASGAVGGADGSASHVGGSGKSTGPDSTGSTTKTSESMSSESSSSTSESTSSGSETTATEETSTTEPSGPVLFEDTFDQPDGLITNDFAHWNPNNSQSVKSADWEMTSGSLFAKDGEAFTGVPDGCEDSTPTSVSCTGSAVFRLNSVRRDFGDVALSLNVVNDRLVTTSRTPAVDFDGIHLWLRYQSEYELYAVSFNRRDGHIVIKKKCEGGSENGGTYYELGKGELAGFPIPFGAVQHVTATARNLPSGFVELTLARDGSTLLSVVDEGVGCAPITAPGAIGVRGDNDEFSFDDLAVSSL